MPRTPRTPRIRTPKAVAPTAPVVPAPEIGATRYYKTSSNGGDVYTSLAYAGNDPYGHTAVTKDDYAKGLQSKITEAQNFMNTYVKEGSNYVPKDKTGWTGMAYSGPTYNPESITKYQEELTKLTSGQGNYADTYRDPSLAKFQANAPTTSEQYFTPEHFSTLAPGEQQRLKSAYPQQYASMAVGAIPAGKKQVQIGNTYALVDVAAPNLSPADQAAELARQEAARATQGATPSPGTTTPQGTVTPPAGTVTTPPAGTTTQGAFSGPNLSQGSTGPMVSQLQQALGGISVDGVFGPKTLEAVKKFQQANGLVADGIVGPKTMAVLNGVKTSTNTGAGGSGTGGAGTGTPSTADTGTPTPPSTTNGKTPFQNVMDTYADVYEQLGLTTIKDQYEKILKEQGELQDKMNDEMAEINNNPWYSEGKRVGELKKLEAKYETKLQTLTNLETLYDSLYKEGQSEARYLVGEIQEETQNAVEMAQKKIDAANALAKDNQIVSINGRQVLVNRTTGEKVADLGAVTRSGSGSSSGDFTKSQINQGSNVLGLTPSQFDTLTYQEQNDLVNSPEKFSNPGANVDEGESLGFLEIIEGVATGDEDFDTVFNEIKSAGYSTVLKNSLLQRLVDAQNRYIASLKR